MTPESPFSHPYLGLAVSIAAYGAGCWVKAKIKSPLANPLLIATTIVILILQYSPFTLEDYRRGGQFITMFIVPATVVLAIQINRQWSHLRANAIPTVGACLAGCAASIFSVWLLCHIFGINETVTASMLPKSVTTAISIELSERTNGIPSLTISAVILTGLMSAILSPAIIRIFKLTNHISSGLAIGVSGHAIGTAKALELGDTEGAFSSIALGLSGIATSIIYVVWF